MLPAGRGIRSRRRACGKFEHLRLIFFVKLTTVLFFFFNVDVAFALLLLLCVIGGIRYTVVVTGFTHRPNQVRSGPHIII